MHIISAAITKPVMSMLRPIDTIDNTITPFIFSINAATADSLISSPPYKTLYWYIVILLNIMVSDVKKQIKKESRIETPFLTRPEGFEPPTFWSVAKRSIQLSQGRISISIIPLQSRLVNCAYG